MLWFDVTCFSEQRHRSGLMRTSARLQCELRAMLGDAFRTVVWHSRRRCWLDTERGTAIEERAEDRLVTPELFSEDERPGFGAWLTTARVGKAALYHDAIPVRFPEITWPKSVARHPHYLKMLLAFDVVLANSAASAAELRDYWRWLGAERAEPVALPLGADGCGAPRATFDANRSARRSIVMCGILEPRKNQTALLDAAEHSWRQGRTFDLVFAGRVNPHFGRPIERRIRVLAKAGRAVRHVANLDDDGLGRLLEEARFTVLPSLAEGCGLPVLESLWAGVPVVATDLPAIRESAAGGGCVLVPADDTCALVEAVDGLLADDASIVALARAAVGRPLPTWRDTAQAVVRALGM
ncbi:hypothetical protein ASA1KI_20070 [Opitutales bacterium ASA1]|uniref:glycosyltransferase n=1 Tax=Congregicoccus parvus TaxID=3081749 RepID=UPI002B2DC818|nr:hypothetical protein ASA1KI_20070 [Opitutales bacterium ASA1]